jgi:hypothetical protein
MSSNPFAWHDRRVAPWLWPTVDQLLAGTPPEHRGAMAMCLDRLDEEGRPLPPGPSILEVPAATS